MDAVTCVLVAVDVVAGMVTGGVYPGMGMGGMAMVVWVWAMGVGVWPLEAIIGH